MKELFSFIIDIVFIIPPSMPFGDLDQVFVMIEAIMTITILIFLYELLSYFNNRYLGMNKRLSYIIGISITGIYYLGTGTRLFSLSISLYLLTILIIFRFFKGYITGTSLYELIISYKIFLLIPGFIIIYLLFNKIDYIDAKTVKIAWYVLCSYLVSNEIYQLIIVYDHDFLISSSTIKYLIATMFVSGMFYIQRAGRLSLIFFAAFPVGLVCGCLVERYR